MRIAWVKSRILGQRVWAQPMCVLESRDVPGLRGAEGPACRGWLPGEGVGRVGRVGAVDRAQRLARGAGCRSGRALPACHVNKETKRGHEASFFSRPRKSAVVMRRGLRPAPRALPRVGRMPPPGPPGLRPLCAVRHTGTCYLLSSGEGGGAWGEGRGREGAAQAVHRPKSESEAGGEKRRLTILFKRH